MITHEGKVHGIVAKKEQIMNMRSNKPWYVAREQIRFVSVVQYCIIITARNEHTVQRIDCKNLDQLTMRCVCCYTPSSETANGHGAAEGSKKCKRRASIQSC